MSASTSLDPAVLTCWKDIANYLGKGVRTVQRWEHDLGLPVRRPEGLDHKSSVVVYSRDLDVWLHSRWSRRLPHDAPTLRHPNAERAALSTEITDGLRISRELRAELRLLRGDHHNLIQQLASSLTLLRQNCRQQPWASDTTSQGYR
ncbi:MAG TPA: hypothetical protein VK670_00945 [Silvibacterium sp.]|nr:hypothetical protein [Silvibacterium sp.]